MNYFNTFVVMVSKKAMIYGIQKDTYQEVRSSVIIDRRNYQFRKRYTKTKTPMQIGFELSSSYLDGYVDLYSCKVSQL